MSDSELQIARFDLRTVGSWAAWFAITLDARQSILLISLTGQCKTSGDLDIASAFVTSEDSSVSFDGHI